MFRNSLILLGLIGLAVSGQGRAQEVGVPRSETVVVTGSRLPSTSATTPVSVTIVTRDEIDAFQPADTVDLLRRISGVHIDQPSGLGGVSSIYVRGAEPNYTQILIDGVQVNDPTNSRGGSFDVSSIDMQALERVEIIRGSGSAVRGADAIAGTINFITRGPGTELQYSLAVSGGADGYARTSVGSRGPLSPAADLAITAAYVDDGDATEGSRFHNRLLNAKSSIFPSDDTSLKLVARLSDSDSSNFPDDSGGPVFAVRRTSDTRDATEFSLGAVFEGECLPAGVIRSMEAITGGVSFTSPGVAPVRAAHSAFRLTVAKASLSASICRPAQASRWRRTSNSLSARPRSRRRA